MSGWPLDSSQTRLLWGTVGEEGTGPKALAPHHPITPDSLCLCRDSHGPLCLPLIAPLTNRSSLRTSDTTAEDCRAWPRLQNSLHLTFLQNGCSWPCSDLLMCHKMPTVSNYYTRLVPYLKLTTMIQSLDQSTSWFLTLLQKETKVLPFSDDPLWSPQKPKSGSCTRRR